MPYIYIHQCGLRHIKTSPVSVWLQLCDLLIAKIWTSQLVSSFYQKKIHSQPLFLIDQVDVWWCMDVLCAMLYDKYVWLGTDHKQLMRSSVRVIVIISFFLSLHTFRFNKRSRLSHSRRVNGILLKTKLWRDVLGTVWPKSIDTSVWALPQKVNPTCHVADRSCSRKLIIHNSTECRISSAGWMQTKLRGWEREVNHQHACYSETNIQNDFFVI